MLSMRKRYEVCSAGQLTFAWQRVSEPVVVNASSFSCEDSPLWIEQAYQLATAKLNRSVIYDSYAYVLPSEASDCAAGLGYSIVDLYFFHFFFMLPKILSIF
jgi:hypothetical protein